MAYIPFLTNTGQDFILSDSVQYYVTGNVDDTFTITLYQNTAEKIRVDKTSYLTQVSTLTGALRDRCSLVNPVIMIEQTSLPTFNYVYIEAFNRYYFVGAIDSVRFGLWQITLDCDVLMTYKDGILGLTTTVSRNQTVYDPFIYDRKALKRIDKKYTIIDGIDDEAVIFNTPTTFSLDTYGRDGDFLSRYRYVVTSAVHGTISAPNGAMPMWTTFPCNFKYLLNEKQLGQAMYNINGISLTAIANIFSNNPIESILSIKAYPFDFYHLNGDTWSSDRQGLMMFGNYDASIVSGNVFYFDAYATEHNEFDILNCYIPKSRTTWKDYTATYSLYAPFYGFINIPAEELIGRYFRVKYVIDFNTGLCLCKIGYATNGTFADFTETMKFSFNIGIDIPVSSTNWNDVIRHSLETGLLLMGASSFGVTTSIGAIETDGNTGATNAPLEHTGSFPNVFIKKKDLAQITASAEERSVSHMVRGNNGGNAAYDIRSSGSPYFIKETPDYFYPTNYAKEQGYPLYDTYQLSNLHGYTECINVKITGAGFASALEPEVDEIKLNLESGVILPINP